MKRFLILSALAFLVPGSPAKAKDSCLACHADASAEIVDAFRKDVHAAGKLSCADCHGGAPEEDGQDAAMNKAEGFIGVPPRTEIGKLCDRCHGDIEYMRKYNPSMRVDQYKEYLTSVHGKRNQAGDKKTATCIDCHGVHGILPTKDPLAPVYPKNVAKTCGKCHSDTDRMREYKIPTDQAENYMKSIHAQMIYEKDDLSAPTCNDCHGNHGAVPPGVRSVVEICGRCHRVQEDNLKAGPHEKIFEEAQIAPCTTCHSNHLIRLRDDSNIAPVEKSICATCHSKDDAGWNENVKIAKDLNRFKERIAAVNRLLDSADRKGIDASSAKFTMTSALDHLIKTRVLIHTMNDDMIRKETEPGIKECDRAKEKVLSAIKDREIRKTGLALSVFFIVLLAVSIYLYAREREKSARRKN